RQRAFSALSSAAGLTAKSVKLATFVSGAAARGVAGGGGLRGPQRPLPRHLAARGGHRAEPSHRAGGRDVSHGGAVRRAGRVRAVRAYAREGVIMEKFVTVARFSVPVEAELACGRLEAEGIPAGLLGEFGVSMLGGWSDPFGGIQLQVP